MTLHLFIAGLVAAEILLLAWAIWGHYGKRQWRKRCPPAKPCWLGMVSADYERWEWWGAWPEPLDALTITAAVSNGHFGWLRDEREHEPLRMGVVLDDGYFPAYRRRDCKVVAIFANREEYLAWKKKGAWPRVTGQLNRSTS